jgi:hypothetical protein
VTDALETVAAGLAERLWTRVAAQDRREALDEHATDPTLCQRLRADPALLDALVEEGLDVLLGAVAGASRRAQLRALREGGSAADDELVGAGLAQASWTGDQVTVSPAGEAVSRLLDEVAELAAAALRERVVRHVPG